MNHNPVLTTLFPCERLPALGPGQPNSAVKSQLESLTLEKIFDGATITNHDMAQCCLSGLWLAHDFLDESHRISQDINTPEGSYWHGIMHRREPDYSNAKYWFRRVGRHEVFDSLSVAARELAQQFPPDRPAQFLMTSYDPMMFIDLCESIANGQSTSETLARRVAQAEWQLLFEHCYRAATA